jgi:hypothetical protein
MIEISKTGRWCLSAMSCHTAVPWKHWESERAGWWRLVTEHPPGSWRLGVALFVKGFFHQQCLPLP